MHRLGFLSIFAAVYMCAPTRTTAQSRLESLGVPRAQKSFLSGTRVTLIAPAAFTNSTGKSNRSLLWAGFAIGAGSGALLGAMWGKHVDKQQVCPNTGPCGGRSNAGPYAVVGAAIGGVLGAAVGCLARNR